MKTTTLTKPGNSHIAALATAFAFTVATINLLLPSVCATTLTASDSAAYDYFGESASSLSGNGDSALVGASYKNSGTGAVYYYTGLTEASASGGSDPVRENIKLIAFDGAEGDYFGRSASLSGDGDSALVGASSRNSGIGAVYYYTGLTEASASGGSDPVTVTETVKLIAFDGGAEGDYFGNSASLSGAGDRALVGASYKNSATGAVYYYTGLTEASARGSSGPVTESIKLIAFDGAAYDYFGDSASLSGDGDSALVGASYKNSATGAVYYYTGLTEASASGSSGPVTESIKLIAFDGAEGDYFGDSASLSGDGDSALVGAYGKDEYSGAAYYYTGLTEASASGGSDPDPVAKTVKLIASDGVAEGDAFGNSVSLSGDGDSALVAASGKDFNTGAVYYYTGLTEVSASGGSDPDPVAETVKLIASGGMASAGFGRSVSLSGDRFVIGAAYARVDSVTTGKAYAGDIRAFTTLDAGNDNGDGTALATDGLSFVSQTNWIIGKETANNTVTLTAGDTATVTADDKAVYIGQTAGADNNTLHIEGTLTATTVYVGAGGSDSTNTGNTLAIGRTGQVAAGQVNISEEGTLAFDLGASGENGLLEAGTLTLNGGSTLRLTASAAFVATDGAEWTLINASTIDGTFGAFDLFDPGAGYAWNTDQLYSAGTLSIVVVTAVPEPATWATLAGLALLAFAEAVRRHRGPRA
jgi:hypothetical protein